jgi:UDP-N-acetylmuramyl pentapeptide synthase
VVDGGDAAAIAAGAASAGLPASRCRRVATLEALDALLAAEVRPGDAVLFKASRVVGLDRSARALMAALEGSTGA